MNKKGINGLGLSIISIVLIIFAGIFVVIFYDQIIDQYLITPLDDVSHQVVDDLGLSEQTNNTLNSLKTAYDNRGFPYDLFTIFFVLVAFIGTSITAKRAAKQGMFSFFGYIFIFSMIFLLVMFFISQFTDYFITNIFIPIFNDITLDVPFTFYFFENLNVISFIWFLWLGLINQIDFKRVVETASDLGGFQR